MTFKIVGGRSDKDLQAKRMSAEIDAAICDLTANLLRICRGAGQPYGSTLARQAARFVDAVCQYENLTGHVVPPDLIAKALDTAPDFCPGLKSLQGHGAQISDPAHQRQKFGRVRIIFGEVLFPEC